MDSYKIGIVEDEVIIAETIALYLARLQYEVAFIALSYEEAIAAIECNRPDLLLVDINLGSEKDGIDLAGLLKQKYKLPFLFLTANSDKATIAKAKLVKPIAFLVKPFTQNGLYSSIEIAMSNIQQFSDTKEIESNYIQLNEGKRYLKLNYEQICYLENSHVYINIYLADGRKERIRGAFFELLSKLPRNQFSQISRSHIVNRQYIDKVINDTILIGGIKLPISRSRKKQLVTKSPFS